MRVFVCICRHSGVFAARDGHRSAQLVHRTLVTNQVSPALGLKMGYVYLAIPISGFFLVIYSLELFINTFVALIKHGQTEVPHIFRSGTLD